MRQEGGITGGAELVNHRHHLIQFSPQRACTRWQRGTVIKNTVRAWNQLALICSMHFISICVEQFYTKQPIVPNLWGIAYKMRQW